MGKGKAVLRLFYLSRKKHGLAQGFKKLLVKGWVFDRADIVLNTGADPELGFAFGAYRHRYTGEIITILKRSIGPVIRLENHQTISFIIVIGGIILPTPATRIHPKMIH